ncbi:MAG: MoaD/ThiS family protein [Cyclobacteriaceae bacterium]
MEITIHTFGVLKNYFSSQETLSVPEGITVKEIIEQLIANKPEPKQALLTCRVAIDEEMVSLEKEIKGNQVELFLLPPSSGG